MIAVKKILFGSSFFFVFCTYSLLYAALTTKEDTPDFPTPAKWFNSETVTKKDFSGKITLLYFWSFASPDSLRDLPNMAVLQKTYAPSGLQIIGIHSPQLYFEHFDSNIERTIDELNITFPVLHDAELVMARRYNTFEYPSFFLIDSHAQLRYRFYGNGQQKKIDSALFELFKQTDINFSLEPEKTPNLDGIPIAGQKMIALGFKNVAALGNSEKVKVSTSQLFKFPESMSSSYYYLSGKWRFESDRIVSSAPNAKLYFNYTDSGFNLIAGTQKSNPVTVKIISNGTVSVDKSNRGSDLFEKDGETFITLNPFKVYRLLKSDRIQETTVELLFPEEGAEIFGLSTGNIEEIKPIEEEEKPKKIEPQEPQAQISTTFEN